MIPSSSAQVPNIYKSIEAEDQISARVNPSSIKVLANTIFRIIKTTIVPTTLVSFLIAFLFAIESPNTTFGQVMFGGVILIIGVAIAALTCFLLAKLLISAMKSCINIYEEEKHKLVKRHNYDTNISWGADGRRGKKS